MAEIFYERLGYAFKNPHLLKQALTHRSVGEKNNERLEFLGDAVLNLAISTLLVKKFTQCTEGTLSRVRASIVNKDSLAEAALSIHLGDVLYLGPGELRTGGHRRASILADALEAVLGAVYLDANFETVCGIIEKIFSVQLTASDLLTKVMDYKSMLQEWLQAQKQALPVYTLIQLSGRGSAQLFHVKCTVSGMPGAAEGRGPTRRKAEQEAAYQFLGLYTDL